MCCRKMLFLVVSCFGLLSCTDGQYCRQGTFKKVPKPLGMENFEIQDTQLTASTSYNQGHLPSRGRLNIALDGGLADGWAPETADANQWLQVDFLQKVTLAKISIQARSTMDQWVSSYSVSYSNDGVNFQFYQKDGQTAVFPGNTERNTIVDQTLSPNVVARFVRVHPKTWHAYVSMRLEFHGWYEEGPRPLGMQSFKIKDSQLSASTSYNEYFLPHHARLNQISGSEGWAVEVKDLNQWLQVDFLDKVTLVKISIQGLRGKSQWVTSYSVSSSDDGNNFQFYEENGQTAVFPGTTGSDTIADQTLSPAVVARFVRLHPKAWYQHIAMRVEFHGWYGVSLGMSHEELPFDCSQRCMEQTACSAFSFRRSTNEAEINCKLYTGLINVGMEKWSHYELEGELCPSYNRCVNPATCVANACDPKGYSCICADGSYSGEFCEVKKLNIHLKGAGCEDPGINDCRLATAVISVNGVDLSPNRRGCNIVVINEENGLIVESKSFDTHDGQLAPAAAMTAYLDGLPPRRIVLVATSDEPANGMTSEARDSLIRLGATAPFLTEHRSSLALIGYTGPGIPSYVSQVVRGLGAGPSVISKELRIIIN